MGYRAEWGEGCIKTPRLFLILTNKKLSSMNTTFPCALCSRVGVHVPYCFCVPVFYARFSAARHLKSSTLGACVALSLCMSVSISVMCVSQLHVVLDVSECASDPACFECVCDCVSATVCQRLRLSDCASVRVRCRRSSCGTVGMQSAGFPPSPICAHCVCQLPRSGCPTARQGIRI